MGLLNPLTSLTRWPARRLRAADVGDRTLAIALAVLAGAIVYAVSVLVFPHHSVNHDEGVYLQQAEMLIAGQLVLTPPVAGVFRPWFFVADGGHLYPKYAPIPAAIFAAGELLGRPRLALAGVAAGLCYLTWAVTAEVFDTRTGLLAGLYLVASPLFVIDSAVFLPYAPTTLLTLTFALGYLRADRTGDRRWAGLAGVALGAAVLSRPYTALVFAVPFGVHAAWTLRDLDPGTIGRQVLVAGGGLGGVVVALSYNAIMTGSPLVFPYEAFAPSDGLGFGRRAIVGYERRYTPSLALRANARVLLTFITRWIVAGPLGGAVAGIGLITLVGRTGDGPWANGSGGEEISRQMARRLVLAGLIVAIPVGNVYFWGNLNILGSLADPGDGLIRYLGPYYHFDLLVPFVAFAAAGTMVVVSAGRSRLGGLRARPVSIAVLMVGAVVFASMAGAALAPPIVDNHENSRQLAAAYDPVSEGEPPNAVVFLPTPHGPWLNHPFQQFRNDPGFDGRTIYAIDRRPFAVVDTYPDRDYYRYVYRGAWAPTAGDPVAARLQRVRHVAGSRVELDTTVGLPPGVDASIRLAAGDETAYYDSIERPPELSTSLVVTNGTARLVGDDLATLGATNGTVRVHTGMIRMTIFADYGQDAAFSYRLALPIRNEQDRIRALTPRIEVCHDPRLCGGEAGYVPRTTDPDIFVRSTLTADREAGS